MIGYVDDISVVTQDEPTLVRAIQIVKEFQDDFQVPVSSSKPSLWGNDLAGLQRASSWAGHPVREVISALGMVWALTGKKTEYKKEQSSMRPRDAPDL